jgi:DNA repair photolyase
MLKMDKTQYIGITETSDPCFHLDIFDNLYDANIIITKNLTPKLIEKLVENKEKCILHMTVTGMGGSKIEPFVPEPIKMFDAVNKLVSDGFPVEQIVLRVDPIVPTEKGVETALNTMLLFQNIGITRLRVSFLDMYNHTKERFIDNHIKIPYETFHADENIRKEAFNKIYEYGIKMGYDIIQTCGEPDFENTPCISQMDIDILGLSDKITLEGNKQQRKNCGCPANKRQLISWEQSKVKCGHNCLYCYMKDNKE